MKVASVVMLLLSSAEASFRLGDFFKDNFNDKMVKPDGAEPEEEIPVVGYPFLFGGLIYPTACADVAKFCDISAHGDLGWLYCYSAQKAIAGAVGGWGLGGFLYIGATSSGVSTVDITTKSEGGALAFNFAAGLSESEAGIDITAESFETTENEDPDPEYAAARGLGIAQVRPYGLAKAAGLNSIKVGSKTFSSNQILVKGKQITKFEAVLSGSFGYFKSAKGGTTQKAANQLAAAAYTQALVDAAEEWKDKYVIKEDKDTVIKNAKVVAEAFGDTFAKGIGDLIIRYRIAVKIVGLGSGNFKYDFSGASNSLGKATAECSDEQR